MGLCKTKAIQIFLEQLSSVYVYVNSNMEDLTLSCKKDIVLNVIIPLKFKQTNPTTTKYALYMQERSMLMLELVYEICNI